MDPAALENITTLLTEAGSAVDAVAKTAMAIGDLVKDTWNAAF
ncbi:hypothetical protein ACFYVR_20780 [Rhodococcus sp. NPDC003318]